MSEIDIINSLPDLSMYRNKNIPIEKLIDLRKKGLSYQQVASIVGCSKINVLNRLKAYCNDIDNLESFKNNRADILAIKQSRLVNSITEAAINKMPVRDRVVSFGILYDKERLERGQSTDNLSIRSLSADLDELIAQCQAKLEDKTQDDVDTQDVVSSGNEE